MRKLLISFIYLLFTVSFIFSGSKEVFADDYTVTFDYQGKKQNNTTDISYNCVNLPQSEYEIYTDDKNYIVTGWYTDQLCNNLLTSLDCYNFDETNPLTGNVTYYAKWTSTKKISGHVTCNSIALENISVNATDLSNEYSYSYSTSTDSDGYYEIIVPINTKFSISCGSNPYSAKVINATMEEVDKTYDFSLEKISFEIYPDGINFTELKQNDFIFGFCNDTGNTVSVSIDSDAPFNVLDGDYMSTRNIIYKIDSIDASSIILSALNYLTLDEVIQNESIAKGSYLYMPSGDIYVYDLNDYKVSYSASSGVIFYANKNYEIVNYSVDSMWKLVELKYHVHTVDDSAVYTWSSDYRKCLATINCITEGEEHTAFEFAQIYSDHYPANNFLPSHNLHVADFDYDFFENKKEIEIDENPEPIITFDITNKQEPFKYGLTDDPIIIKTTCLTYHEFYIKVDDEIVDTNNVIANPRNVENVTNYDFIFTSDFLSDIYYQGDTSHTITIVIKDEDGHEASTSFNLLIELSPLTADLCIAHHDDYLLYVKNDDTEGSKPKDQIQSLDNLSINYDETNKMYILELLDDVTICSNDFDSIRSRNGNSIKIIGNNHTLTFKNKVTYPSEEIVDSIKYYFAVNSGGNLYLDGGNDGKYGLTIQIEDMVATRQLNKKSNGKIGSLINGFVAYDSLIINNTNITANIGGSFASSLRKTTIKDSQIKHNIYATNSLAKVREIISGEVFDEQYFIYTFMPGYDETFESIEINNSKVYSNIGNIDHVNFMPMGIYSQGSIDINKSTVDLHGVIDKDFDFSQIEDFEEIYSMGIFMLPDDEDIDFDAMQDMYIKIKDSKFSLKGYLIGIFAEMSPVYLENSDVIIDTYMCNIVTLNKMFVTYNDNKKHVFDLKGQMVGNVTLQETTIPIPIIVVGSDEIYEDEEETHVTEEESHVMKTTLSESSPALDFSDYENYLILDLKNCRMRSNKGNFVKKDIPTYKHIYINFDGINPNIHPVLDTGVNIR